MDGLTSLRHSMQNEMVNIYNNKLPYELERLFDGKTRLKINPLRRSWDDFVTMGALELPPYARPNRDSDPERKASEKLEKIAYGWHGAASRIGRGWSMEGVMQQIIWWLVGTANAVVMATPDHRHQTPFIFVRDPRTYYAPPGYSPWGQATLDDVIFRQEKPAWWLMNRYPDSAGQLKDSLQAGRGGDFDEKQPVEFVEFYGSDQWEVVTCTGRDAVTMSRSLFGDDPQHPGCVPVVEMTLYNPSGARPWYADLVSFDAALGRILAQDIEYGDQVLYGPIVTTGFEHKDFRGGPLGVNVLKTGPEIGGKPYAERLAPTSQLNADRMVQLLTNLLRTESRNPEALQGGGDANSGRAIEALKSGPQATMEKFIWPAPKEGIPRVYTLCSYIEINCWGDVEKKIGVETQSHANPAKRGASHVTYIPNRDLRGREFDLRIEPGLGLASYQDSVEVQQRLGSRTISRMTALERFPDIPDPEAESRRIESDENAELLMATLAQAQQAGQLQPGAMAEVVIRTEAGEPRAQVILDLDRQGKLTMAQLAPEGGMGAPGAPGQPSPEELAAQGVSMLSGGGASPGSLPFEMMRSRGASV